MCGLLLSAVVLAGSGIYPAEVKELSVDSSARPNPLAGARLYVDRSSNAHRQAEEWLESRPDDARHLLSLAAEPQARWFGDWSGDIRRDVDRVVTMMVGVDALPVLVAYNIPQRDCGLHSSGGAASGPEYRKWIRQFTAGLAGRRAVVVLEPDGLGATRCLSDAERAERFDLFRDAVEVLKEANAAVYVDAGNPGWLRPEEMAPLLRRAGIEAADGFALNVSNFHTDAANLRYGERLSELLGGKHFIVDTSRNGRGPTAANEWCNPRDRALGTRPTVLTGHPLADAFLWIKPPGESDGECNGGPQAGHWWAEDAVSLARG